MLKTALGIVGHLPLRETISLGFKTPHNAHFPQTLLTAPFLSFAVYLLTLHLLNVRAKWAQSSELSPTLTTPTPLLTTIRWMALNIIYMSIAPYLHFVWTSLLDSYLVYQTICISTWMSNRHLGWLYPKQHSWFYTTYMASAPTQNYPYLYIGTSSFLLLWPKHLNSLLMTFFIQYPIQVQTLPSLLLGYIHKPLLFTSPLIPSYIQGVHNPCLHFTNNSPN